MDNVKQLHKHYYYQVNKYTGISRHCAISDKDFKHFKSGTMGSLSKDSTFSVYVEGKIKPVYTGDQATFYIYKNFNDNKYYLVDNVFYLIIAITHNYSDLKGDYGGDSMLTEPRYKPDTYKSKYTVTKSGLSYPKWIHKPKS